jgi:hypothetical protein
MMSQRHILMLRMHIIIHGMPQDHPVKKPTQTTCLHHAA